MEVLRIEWHRTFDEHGEGYMELILDKFFPCTIEKANKIFKLVGRWCPDETIAELDVYLHQEKEKAYTQMKSDVKAYGDARQNVFDLQTIIVENKHPNGVKLTKMEQQDFTEKLKDAKRTKRALYKSSRSLKTKVERYNRNIELLHTHTQMKGSD